MTAIETGHTLPHSLEAEESLLSSCLLDGADVVARCLEAKIGTGSFYDSKHGVVFARLLDLYNRKEPITVSVVAEELKSAGTLEQIGGYAFLTQVSSRIPTTAQAGYFIKTVRDLELRRRVMRAGQAIAERARGHAGPDVDQLISDVNDEIERATSLRSLGSVIAELAPRRAGFGRIVPKQAPVVSLLGTAIFTRENISMCTAQKKEGKSTAEGGIISALVGGSDCGGDTLGFTAHNASGEAVIHLDTEQAPEDHERLIETALKRAGREIPPWLHSYGVKGLSVAELLRHLDRLLKETAKLHGGVCLVILDGVADFVSDPNDPKECNPFVTRLESIATDYNCHVHCVLHLNPVSGRNAATKSRGHLGSQLERKCETDLRLVKNADGVTTMFTACARRSPIFEKDGPRFSFDKAAGMHLSLSGSNCADRDNAEAEHLREIAEEVFEGGKNLRASEVVDGIKTVCKLKSESQAAKKKALMAKLGVIEKFGGRWALKNCRNHSGTPDHTGSTPNRSVSP